MPQITDVFNQNPFSAVELTNAMRMIDQYPTLLGDMGERLFPTIRTRVRTVAVLKTTTQWRLIPVSPIGAPPVELEKQPGELRPFLTKRLAKGSTIYAEEIQGLLYMPMPDAVATLQDEVANRAGKIRSDIDFTDEHMRLGAVLGKVVDADGLTVIDDWFANWGVPVPAAFNFHLDQTVAGIRGTCLRVIDAMADNSHGSWVEGVTECHALVGKEFYSSLVTHPEVERLYLNWQAARDLAGEIEDDFTFGGIIWHRYRQRGAAPNSELSVGEDEARFFPVGASDAFQRVLAPAEFFPFVNQPGEEVYAMTIPDRDRNAWVRVEDYQYPLFMCLRPEMLQRAVGR